MGKENAVPENYWETLIELETELTAFELLLLFKVATGNQDMGPIEPVWNHISDGTLLHQAPYLAERSLREMACQARLIRLNLLEFYREEAGVYFALTSKGHEAVDWWLAELEDMGFSHDTLKAT